MIVSSCSLQRLCQRRCLYLRHMKFKHAVAISGVLFMCVWLTLMSMRDANFVFVNEDIAAKCILPNLDPFHPSMVRHYMMDPGEVVCQGRHDFILFHNNGSSALNLTSSSHIEFPDFSLDCFFKEIHRVNDFEVEYSREKRYVSPDLVLSDSFQILCYDEEKNVRYKDIHNKITPKVINAKPNMDHQMNRFEDLNVIIFGIDSLSRLAAHRALMTTMKFIKNDLGAYDFHGYTKVGDNTFPNLIPLLTGATVDEWGYFSYNYADVYPFIWHNFSRQNYRTFYGEDRADINTFSSAMYYGFNKPPADHYIRPGFLAMMEANSAIGLQLYGIDKKLVSWTHNQGYFCHGVRPKHQILLDYLKNFLRTYKKEKMFAFLWTSQLGHANVNHFQKGDSDYKNLFEWMNTEGIFNNTIMFFLSDHGSRFDHLRNTYMGRIEDRMPLLSIVLPRHLLARYPVLKQNLKENQFKVTSPFDVFHTIDDVLHNNFKGEVKERKHGASLFNHLSDDRSCADCGIPESYCTCYTTLHLDLDKPEIKKAAQHLVQELNRRISDKPECMSLTLKSVLNAELVELGLKRNKWRENFSFKSWWHERRAPEGNPSNHYLLTIQVNPSGATYEATVIFDAAWDKIEISGDISRTNAYGNTAWCMKEKVLKPFCFCVEKN